MAYYVQAQPAPVQVMTVSPGGNRNAKNLPMGPDGREWSNGFCDCQCGTCLCAWCVPCILYGRIKSRYDHLNTKGYPDPSPGCCSGSCCLHACLLSFGFGWVLQMGLRGNIRSRYHIKGGGCGDCCAAFCCTPCELTQESQELELEERSLGKK